MIEYLRHRNGFGKLFDDAEANAATYISRDSSASGMAKLRDCGLHVGSKAEGECQVYGGQYYITTIRGSTICAGKPKVFGSTLDCSEISGTPMIESSQLLGRTEVCDSPIISRSRFCGAIIYGSPTIVDSGIITGRVHEGYWTRAPKHIKLPWCDLSECIDGKVLLDCRCRTVDYWLRHGAKLARRWDWNEDMISVTLETIAREFASVSKAAA